MIDRRQFLSRVVFGALALPLTADFDWDRLLWVPRAMAVVPEMPCLDLNVYWERALAVRTIALSVDYQARLRRYRCDQAYLESSPVSVRRVFRGPHETGVWVDDDGGDARVISCDAS